MDRKGLLIIIVTLAVAFGINYFWLAPTRDREVREYKERMAKWEADQKVKAEAAKANAAAQTPPNANAQATTPSLEKPDAPKPAVPVVQALPEEKKDVASEVGTVNYVFSNHGGGISRVVLNEHLEDKKKGTKIVLNEFGTIPIGTFSENPDKETDVHAPWAMSVNEAERVVTFERTMPGKVNGVEFGQVKITKRFLLPHKPDESDKRRAKLRSEYLVGLDVTYENVGTTDTKVPKLFLHAGAAAPINSLEMPTYLGFDYWRDGSNHFIAPTEFDAGGMPWSRRPEREVITKDEELIRWSGVTNQYFVTLVTIVGGEEKSSDEQRPLLGITSWAKRHLITADEWRSPTEFRPTGRQLSGKTKLYNIDQATAIPEIMLTVGSKVERKFQIYAGPREYRRLRLLEHDEEDVLDYSKFMGIIPTAWFSKMLLGSMNGIYHFVTGDRSYALAIVILTILVKALLWPLQNRANKSMKKMAALSPEMKILQDKYKEDPAKFQQEMGKMWKKAGVNPLSGCWPMLIQIPIFIGFYQMLGKAVELRHHSFLWVEDLSAPDTIATLFGWLPINPLPLIMAGTMFLQMRMAPQGGDPTQRKIFMFMPLMFIFMCYNFASALALYWTIQNIISIVQLVVNRDRNAVKP